MSKVYRINESTLVALANGIRGVTGQTGGIKVEDMSSVGLGNISEEIVVQDELMTDILDALEGKAIGGGSSGGASIETCTVTFRRDSPSPDAPTYYFTDANMNSRSISERSGTMVVPKNTIVAIYGWNTMSTHSGSCTKLFAATSTAAYLISGDCTLTYMG